MRRLKHLAMLVSILSYTAPLLWGQPNADDTLRKLRSSDVQTRRKAITEFVDVLGTDKVKEIGNDVLPVILAGVGDADEEVRVQAFGALNAIAHAMVWARNPEKKLAWGTKVTIEPEREPRLQEHVVKGLDDPNPIIREGAAAFLGMGYRPSKENERLLTARWKAEGTTKVRKALLKALAAGQYSSPESISTLHQMLDDKDADLSGKAARYLGQIKEPRALPKIIEKIKKGDAPMKQQHLRAISEYGSTAKEYLPELERAAKAEKDETTKAHFNAAIRKVKEKKPK